MKDVFWFVWVLCSSNNKVITNAVIHTHVNTYQLPICMIPEAFLVAISETQDSSMQLLADEHHQDTMICV